MEFGSEKKILCAQNRQNRENKLVQLFAMFGVAAFPPNADLHFHILITISNSTSYVQWQSICTDIDLYTHTCVEWKKSDKARCVERLHAIIHYDDDHFRLVLYLLVHYKIFFFCCQRIWRIKKWLFSLAWSMAFAQHCLHGAPVSHTTRHVRIFSCFMHVLAVAHCIKKCGRHTHTLSHSPHVSSQFIPHCVLNHFLLFLRHSARRPASDNSADLFISEKMMFK